MNPRLVLSLLCALLILPGNIGESARAGGG